MQASHLLKYDSMLGTFKADVKILNDETITVDGKPIKVVSSRDPLKLPWAELGIDIVIEVRLSEFDACTWIECVQLGFALAGNGRLRGWAWRG